MWTIQRTTPAGDEHFYYDVDGATRWGAVLRPAMKFASKGAAEGFMASVKRPPDAVGDPDRRPVWAAGEAPGEI